MTNREQYDTVNLSKNDKKENNLDKMDKHKRLYQNTKFLVDIIFVAEILITLIMPFSIPWLNRNFSHLQGMDLPMIIIYMLVGTVSIAATWILKMILKTVVSGNCFVQENVLGLKRISVCFLMILILLVCRALFYLTLAILIDIFLFFLAFVFCRVVALVFQEAVRHKEENDLTI